MTDVSHVAERYREMAQRYLRLAEEEEDAVQQHGPGAVGDDQPPNRPGAAAAARSQKRAKNRLATTAPAMARSERFELPTLRFEV